MPDRPPPPRRNTLKRVTRGIVRAYLTVCHRFRVFGADNLPARGPVLVLTNHVSLLDVPAFGMVDPYEGSRFVIKASLMKVPMMEPVLRAWGAIPVDRDGEDSTALREMLSSLRDGLCVAAAAEGTRNRDGGFGTVNPVLARLAINTDAPLAPVVTHGTFEALPPGAWFPRPKRVSVSVGPTFDLHALRGLPKDEAVKEAQMEIRKRIMELLARGPRM